MIPCILFEDDHLLVVHKPAGIATHRAGDLAPWGIHEFLLNQRPELKLGVHQRLDRQTSGVMVFSKTSQAGKSIGNQFEERTIKKEYLFLTGGKASKREFVFSTPIEGKPAKTRFQFQRQMANGLDLWKAFPETGRTHQVRIHAASSGLKILGEDSVQDPLLLHATRLELRHPLTGKSVVFEALLPFYFELTDPEQRRLQASLILRQSLLDESETNAYRWIHRHADGFPDLTVDRMGGWIYVEDFSPRHSENPSKYQNLITSGRAPLEGIILCPVSTGGGEEGKTGVGREGAARGDRCP